MDRHHHLPTSNENHSMNRRNEKQTRSSHKTVQQTKTQNNTKVVAYHPFSSSLNSEYDFGAEN